MDIGILTFHRADNYGALLQVYALQQKLYEKANTVEIIDYRCQAIENEYIYNFVPAFRKNLIKWLCNFIKNIYIVPKKRIKAKKCDAFREKYLLLSKSYTSKEDRTYIQKKYDVVFTGSDQIWNTKLTNGKDDWYCLKKEANDTRVVSYGASVGNLKLFSDKFKLFEEDLRKYYMISTRESESAVFLSKKLNKVIYQVLDPTLLVTEQKWSELSEKSNVKLKDKFVLYYDVEKNSLSEKIAKDVSARREYKLVHFDASIKMLFSGKYMQEAGPIEFLWLIRNADFIVTSSFHATVFSILFEKDFCVVPHLTTGSRVRNLLSDLHLEDHLVESLNEYSYDKLPNNTDFKMVKDILTIKQKDSERYIDMCLRKLNKTY